MNRAQFNLLTLEEQLNHINLELQSGETLRNICTLIGIARSTVSDRFKKIGYKFSKECNQYIYYADYESVTKVLQPRKPKKNPITPKDNANKKPKYDKNNTLVIKDNLKQDLLELLEVKGDLMQMLQNYKSKTNVIEVPELNVNNLPQELQDKIVTKSIKVYEPILNKFDALSNTYSSIKKQDLYSMALLEFYEKYKK